MQIALFLSSHTRTHARARALRHARTLCTQSTLESCQPFQTAAKTGARNEPKHSTNLIRVKGKCAIQTFLLLTGLQCLYTSR
jgi:hypothetical protein